MKNYDENETVAVDSRSTIREQHERLTEVLNKFDEANSEVKQLLDETFTEARMTGNFQMLKLVISVAESTQVNMNRLSRIQDRLGR